MLKRTDIEEPFDKDKFGSISSFIKDVVSDGNSDKSNSPHVTFSEKSLLSPASYRPKLVRSMSDTELSELEKHYKRKTTTIGEQLPHWYKFKPIDRKSTPLPKQDLHVINLNCVCDVCNNVYNIKHEMITFFCDHCHAKGLFTLEHFIIN